MPGRVCRIGTSGPGYQFNYNYLFNKCIWNRCIGAVAERLRTHIA